MRRLGGRLSCLVLTGGAAAVCLTAVVCAAADDLADAARQGNKDAVRSLLETGADVNVTTGDGVTALHWAALNGDVDLAKMLLLAGASVRATTRLGAYTPLLMAATNGDTGMIDVLLGAGADPAAPNGNGTTPLMLAAGAGTDLARPRSPEERAMALQTVRFLIERGADVNAAGQFGWTALHSAAYQGLNDIIEFLAAQGAKLGTKDSFGQTPLSISYAIITKEIGDAYYQTPRVFRRDTADLLLKMGATPLDQSGVVAVIKRPTE